MYANDASVVLLSERLVPDQLQAGSLGCMNKMNIQGLLPRFYQKNILCTVQ